MDGRRHGYIYREADIFFNLLALRRMKNQFEKDYVNNNINTKNEFYNLEKLFETFIT